MQPRLLKTPQRRPTARPAHKKSPRDTIAFNRPRCSSKGLDNEMGEEMPRVTWTVQRQRGNEAGFYQSRFLYNSVKFYILFRCRLFSGILTGFYALRHPTSTQQINSASHLDTIGQLPNQANRYAHAVQTNSFKAGPLSQFKA